jgi:hypothetical protein
MTTHRSPEIQRFWPSTQSLDLVKGTTTDVAEAVASELARYTAGYDNSTPSIERRPFISFSTSLGSVDFTTSVPTCVVVLPTRSPWSVLWNNSMLSDGYDSLCANLTNRFGFETIHWSAHDEQTTFQPGAMFCHRHNTPHGTSERVVHASVNDGKWTFIEQGKPLPEETVANYRKRAIRSRSNESTLMKLLARLEARPWSEDYYATEDVFFVIKRIGYPASIVRYDANDA